MRAAFVETVTRLLDEDERIVLLLGDISVHAFQAAAESHPKRVINCGVSEQAMVSMGAGLARAGMYPIMHTIAPFLVERAFEQIKIDFGYHSLPGCFVSVGASYDYSTLGCTHHCPGDVALMLTVPGMEIYVPSSKADVEHFLPKITDDALAYVRLSDDVCAEPPAFRIHANPKAIVIGVGPLRRLLPVSEDVDTAGLCRIDDFRGLRDRSAPLRILVLEPFYAGTLTHLIQEAVGPRPVTIKSIGVPRNRFLTEYGTRQELDAICGLTKESVARELEILLHA